MSVVLPTPPKEICVLRLSAIGDICHTLPVIRTLQAHWPETRITWVIGKLEAALIGDIADMEFIIFDKGRGWRAYTDLRRQLRGRRFDLLLHMQNSMRGNIASRMIKAKTRLGFHKHQCKDHQWWFTNAQAVDKPQSHVMDVLFGFAEALGIQERQLRWDIPLTEADRAFADTQCPAGKPVLAISPCANARFRNWRNWTQAGHVEVIDWAQQQGFHCILTGGPSALEREYADYIVQHCQTKPLDLVGKTSLKQLLALLERADMILSPDSGPAHMGTAVGTPVVGLYASTNPDRARPYLSAEWTVNAYPQAAQAEFGCPVDEVEPWGRRVRNPEAMNQITPAMVRAKIEALAQHLGLCT